MNGNSSDRKRVRKTSRPVPEALESRALLTGGAGNTFALISGRIEQAGATVNVPVVISPSQFTAPKGRNELILGVDVVAQNGSSVAPTIQSITDAQGHVLSTPRAAGGKKGSPIGSAATTSNVTQNAALISVPRPFIAANPLKAQVKIAPKDLNTGTFITGFYLPGDVDGNGIVAQSDVRLTRTSMMLGQTGYTFDADANRDGLINMTDVKIAQANLGAKTLVSPIVTANFDATTDTGRQDRVTASPMALFTGVASPGTSIALTDNANVVPASSVVVGANGKYNLTMNLAMGDNTFHLIASDPFGQSFVGDLGLITRSDNAPVDPPSTTTPTTTTGNNTTNPGNGTGTTTKPNGGASNPTRVPGGATALAAKKNK